MTATLAQVPRLEVHDQVRLADAPGRWEVVAEAGAGRYTVISSIAFDAHSIIDWEIGARGTLDMHRCRVTHPHYATVIRGAAPGELQEGDDALDELVRRLEGGPGVNGFTVEALGITQHLTRNVRGPVIDSSTLSYFAKDRVLAWLRANGCRWLVRDDQVLRIRGQYVEVECMTIREHRQIDTMWPKAPPEDWEPPWKLRRFRIRVPLNPTKGRRS